MRFTVHSRVCVCVCAVGLCVFARQHRARSKSNSKLIVSVEFWRFHKWYFWFHFQKDQMKRQDQMDGQVEPTHSHQMSIHNFRLLVSVWMDCRVSTILLILNFYFNYLSAQQSSVDSIDLLKIDRKEMIKFYFRCNTFDAQLMLSFDVFIFIIIDCGRNWNRDTTKNRYALHSWFTFAPLINYYNYIYLICM